MKTQYLSLFITMIALATAPAATHWVSPDGEASWEASRSDSPLAGKAATNLAIANANAKAGDTIYLRAGTYSGQTIQPRNSGTSEDLRITYAKHADEKVVFEESNGIRIVGKSYISVSGMDFRQMLCFIRIGGGSYNIIEHCRFDGRSKNSGEWVGAHIGAQGQNPSTHNWIHHCEFYRFVYKDERPNRGALLDIGNLNANDRQSSYNRVEHCVLAYGGHHTLGIYSKHNVIRFNYTHNETNPKNWDFPGYRGMVTQSSSGGFCLFEGNRFGYSDQAGIGLRSPGNIFRKNQFYHNGQGGIQVVTNSVGNDRADENLIYHNTFFHNGHRENYAGFQGGLYFAAWNRVTPKQNVVKNNLFFDNQNGAVVASEGPVEPQIVESNWDNSVDPRFADSSGDNPDIRELPDLSLAPNSPAKDQAGWLTTITSKGATTDSFTVADSRYFIDGWGIIEGDRIQLQGQPDSAKILTIDSETNTITVDQQLQIETGQGVALVYHGDAPDPGAFEIGVER